MDVTISLNARELKLLDVLTDDRASWIDELVRNRLERILRTAISESTRFDGNDLSKQQLAAALDAITFKPYDPNVVIRPYNFKELVDTVDKQALKGVFDL